MWIVEYPWIKKKLKNSVKSIYIVCRIIAMCFISLKVISRTFWKEHEINSMTLLSAHSVEITEMYSTITFYWQKFRESDGLTKEITK